MPKRGAQELSSVVESVWGGRQQTRRMWEGCQMAGAGEVGAEGGSGGRQVRIAGKTVQRAGCWRLWGGNQAWHWVAKETSRILPGRERSLRGRADSASCWGVGWRRWRRRQLPLPLPLQPAELRCQMRYPDAVPASKARPVAHGLQGAPAHLDSASRPAAPPLARRAGRGGGRRGGGGGKSTARERAASQPASRRSRALGWSPPVQRWPKLFRRLPATFSGQARCDGGWPLQRAGWARQSPLHSYRSRLCACHSRCQLPHPDSYCSVCCSHPAAAVGGPRPVRQPADTRFARAHGCSADRVGATLQRIQ